jgi:carbon-monoxide dehydrogenase small subunit
MTEAIEIAVTINGRAHRLNVAPRRVLADVLREDLQLLGCKIGCDQAVCGACTVLVDEMPVTACTTFAFEVDRKTVITIEGLAEGGGLGPGPARISGTRRVSMRLLHARHDPVGEGAAGAASRA